MKHGFITVKSVRERQDRGKFYADRGCDTIKIKECLSCHKKFSVRDSEYNRRKYYL